MLEDADRLDIYALQDLKIHTPTGALVPFSSLAFVYLVLAVLFIRFRDPLVVLLGGVLLALASKHEVKEAEFVPA